MYGECLLGKRRSTGGQQKNQDGKPYVHNRKGKVVIGCHCSKSIDLEMIMAENARQFWQIFNFVRSALN
jgi:hypothetical protein